jgi:hypothetical protein
VVDGREYAAIAARPALHVGLHVAGPGNEVPRHGEPTSLKPRLFRAGQDGTGVAAVGVEGGHAEFITVSFRESRAAIEGFAGPDIDKAVFYPEDEAVRSR